MTLRHTAVREANTWKTGWKEMLMVTVSMCATIVSQGTHAVAKIYLAQVWRLLIQRSLEKKPRTYDWR